jgi:apolipoprotein N-acyltransferase
VATFLLGLFTAEAPLPGSDEPRYFNTVLTLGTSELQLYRKRISCHSARRFPANRSSAGSFAACSRFRSPTRTPGDPQQAPLRVAGTRVAVNICYEDAFGAELIDGAQTARILINVTNDAWYGHSIAAWQHNQMAAMRALELGRPLLRATNTGVTSAIGHDGRILAAIPWFTRGVLEVTVQGRTGATPYYRIVDWLAVGIALAVAIAACWLGAKRAR